MDMKLSGKVAVVTGASQGLGLAIARSLAAEGARVAMMARGEQRLQVAVEELRTEGHDAVAVVADLTRPEDIDRAVASVGTRWNRIDVVVNNAGGVDDFATWDVLDDSAWQQAFETNVLSIVRMTRATLPWLRRNDTSRIINIASESGLQPDPFMPNYNAAKAAVLNMSKSMSKAFAADGVLVNSVSPAFVMTPLVEDLMRDEAQRRGVDAAEAQRQFLAEVRPHIELKRAGRPEEVGAAVTFLASAAASFITGTNLRVDGGSVASI